MANHDLQQRNNPYDVTRASRIYLLPNLMTAGNLFCGFVAIIKCIQAHLITDCGEYAQLNPNASWTELYTQAMWFIFAAAIFDFLDGRLARVGGRTSLFGAAFDSLSDVVSFGMAPALVVFFLVLAPREDFQWFRELGWFIAFIYLLCSTVRLARFNMITKSMFHYQEADCNKDFVGLPIPAAAGTVASLVLLLLNLANNSRELRLWALALPFLLVLVAFLMVSTIRYPSFKHISWETKTRLRTAILAILVGVMAWQLQELVFFFLFFGYIIYGLFSHYRLGVRYAQMKILHRKVVKISKSSSE